MLTIGLIIAGLLIVMAVGLGLAILLGLRVALGDRSGATVNAGPPAEPSAHQVESRPY